MHPVDAVIPAAGKGERIRPYSEKVPKPMIQVRGRPILAYVLDRCRNAGIKNVVIVINPESTVLKNYFGDGSDYGLSIDYVDQPEPKGIGHAVSLTEGMIKTPFAVYLGDELYFRSDHLGFIQTFDNTRFAASVGLIRVEDEELIRRNFSVDIDLNTHIIRNFVEKPKKLINNILGCGSYIFNDSVFEAIRKTRKSMKHEIEITDTLNTIRKLGYTICGYFLGGTYLNVTYPEDILEAEKMLDS